MATRRHGYESIAIAQGYPAATVDGFDIDAPSVEMAGQNVRGTGVEARVLWDAITRSDHGLT